MTRQKINNDSDDKDGGPKGKPQNFLQENINVEIPE